jgi:hypothetical protein
MRKCMIVKKTLADRFILLLLSMALLFFLRSLFFGVPLSNDEGIYGYIAQRMLEGELPYKDVADNKPPTSESELLRPYFPPGH